LEENFHVWFTDIQETPNGGCREGVECEGFGVGKGLLYQFWGAEDIHPCAHDPYGVDWQVDFAAVQHQLISRRIDC
jgi:hypothetical protein